MEQFFKLKGKLVYEPVRTELRKTFKAKTLIVDLPFDDLALYYCSVIKQKYGVHLHPPMWGNHVTVVRGDEKPPKSQVWKKHEGETVEFEVSPHLYRNWNFWCLPVRSQQLHDIRKELGLAAFHEMHVTVGREVDQPTKPAKFPAWSKPQLRYLADRPVFTPEAPCPVISPKPSTKPQSQRRVLSLRRST
jgi:hypothetical protein